MRIFLYLFILSLGWSTGAEGADPWSFVDSSDDHTCGIAGGEVFCYGNGEIGQLGGGVFEAEPVLASAPSKMVSVTNAVSVACGHKHTCVLMDDGSLYCAGQAQYLGSGDGTVDQKEPVEVDELAEDTVLQVAAAYFTTCVLLAESMSVTCFGLNAFGALGVNDADVDLVQLVPTNVMNLNQNIRFLQSGPRHFCALVDLSNSVTCWGQSNRGQTGVETVSSYLRYGGVTVDGIAVGGAKMLAVGRDFGVAIPVTANEKLNAWGSSAYKKLGASNTTLPYSRRAVEVRNIGTDVKFVATSRTSDHMCAIASDDTVYCSGRNAEGQCGVGDYAQRNLPEPIVVPFGMDETVVSLIVRKSHSCALDATDRVWCWGTGDIHEYGLHSLDFQSEEPVLIGSRAADPPSGPVAHTPVSLPDEAWLKSSSSFPHLHEHWCGISETDASVWCLGSAEYGKLGNGTEVDSAVPVLVSNVGTGALDIVTTFYSTCVLAAGGSVECFGHGSYIGSGEGLHSSVPVTANGLDSGCRQIVAGFRHVCVMDEGFGVWCFGNNEDYFSLGHNARSSSVLPVRVWNLEQGVRSLHASAYSTCVLMEVSQIPYCWGRNSNGQLSIGSTTSAKYPIRARGMPLGGIKQIAMGNAVTCFVAAVDGAVYCSGYGARYELGNDDTTQVTVAVRTMVLVDNVVHVASCRSCRHFGAIRSGGAAFFWGMNAEGQIGVGSVAVPTKPSQLTALLGSIVEDIIVRNEYSCVRDDSNRVFCFGFGIVRDFGLHVTIDSRIAVEVGEFDIPEPDPLPASNGILVPSQIWRVLKTTSPYIHEHSCGIDDADGSVWCAGSNYHRMLGNGTNALHSHSFVRVHGAGNGVKALVAGYHSTCIINSEDQCACWGQATQIGSGDGTVDMGTPQFVQGLSGGGGQTRLCLDITTHGDHTCALDDEYGVQCWGKNDRGQLGKYNDDSDSLLPSLVPSFQFGARRVLSSRIATCVIVDVTNEIWCFGHGYWRGAGTNRVSGYPAIPEGLPLGGVYDAVMLNQGMCVISALTRAVYCWGNNGFSILGNNSTATNFKAQPTMYLTDSVRRVFGDDSAYHVCAVVGEDADLWCWGRHFEGQLGVGDDYNFTNPNFPVHVHRVPSPVVDVHVREFYTCALSGDGDVRCFGFGLVEAFGLHATINSDEPVVVGTATWSTGVPSEVASQPDPSPEFQVPSPWLLSGRSPSDSVHRHMCVVLEPDRTLWCVGDNHRGQLGNGTIGNEKPIVNEAVQVEAVGTGVRDVSLGVDFTCVIDSNRAVWCFGNGQSIGTGSGMDSGVPIKLPRLVAQHIFAGLNHVCILEFEAEGVLCWGLQENGRLGHELSGLEPERVTHLTRGVKHLVVGNSDALVIMENTNAVYGFGNNYRGMLGVGDERDQRSPSRMHPLRFGGAAQAVLGRESSCVIAAIGRAVMCSGVGGSYQLANNDTSNQFSPVNAKVLTQNVKRIFADPRGSHYCAIDGNDNAVCWGAHYHGELGVGNDFEGNNPKVPVQVAIRIPEGSVQHIHIGHRHTCFKLNRQINNVLCTGKSEYLAYGLHGRVDSIVPVVVGTSDWTEPLEFQPAEPTPIVFPELGWRSFDTSFPYIHSHTCGIDADEGYLWCYGSNQNGKLGIGSTESSHVPVRLDSLGTGVQHVSTGGAFSCAVKTDGSLWCWGDGRYIGSGEGEDSYAPKPVLGLPDAYLTSGVKHLTSSGRATCVIDSGDGVQCFGDCVDGECGNGFERLQQTPVRVTGLESGVKSIAFGGAHICAILVGDQKTVCWGRGQAYRLGDNQYRNKLTPVNVQAGDTTDPVFSSYLTVTSSATIAIQSNDSSVVSWGSNYLGQAGVGIEYGREVRTAIQIAEFAALEVTKVVGADKGTHFCALDIQKRVWCAGRENEGQLGAGEVVSEGHPVLVGGITKDVVDIDVGYEHSCALDVDGDVWCWGLGIVHSFGTHSFVNSAQLAYQERYNSSFTKFPVLQRSMFGRLDFRILNSEFDGAATNVTSPGSDSPGVDEGEDSADGLRVPSEDDGTIAMGQEKAEGEAPDWMLLIAGVSAAGAVCLFCCVLLTIYILISLRRRRQLVQNKAVENHGGTTMRRKHARSGSTTPRGQMSPRGHHTPRGRRSMKSRGQSRDRLHRSGGNSSHSGSSRDHLHRRDHYQQVSISGTDASSSSFELRANLGAYVPQLQLPTHSKVESESEHYGQLSVLDEQMKDQSVLYSSVVPSTDSGTAGYGAVPEKPVGEVKAAGAGNEYNPLPDSAFSTKEPDPAAENEKTGPVDAATGRDGAQEPDKAEK